MLLGTSELGVKKQRAKLGLVRDKFKNHFVIQVTKWLPLREDCNDCSGYFQGRDIEHVIAKTDKGFAVFRTNIELIAKVMAPPKSTWVLHWRPKK